MFISNWWCCIVLFIISLGMICIAISEYIKKHRCPRCRGWMKVHTTVIEHATYTSSGRQRVIRDCPKCGYHDEKEENIPKLTRSSGGSSHSGGGWSSGSSSSRGSFGGGSSGGGGGGSSW